MDCTNRTDHLIQTAGNLGYKGIAITDHEALCSHVEAQNIVKDLKKKGKLSEDFKLILGNEPYLVNSLEEVRDNYEGGVTKFPHYILLAKDKIGHRQLRILSSHAWGNSFKTGLMERVPLEKPFLEKIVNEDKGHLIASTACLGSELGINLIRLQRAENENNQSRINELKKNIHEFITWNINLFGKENFFIELQPALSEEQIYANKKMIVIAKHYDLKWIVSTDVHYLRPEDREVHQAYLNAKEGEREIASFYEACFLMTLEEIKERMDYLDEKDVQQAIDNTLLIGDVCEDYDLAHEPTIPKIQLPEFKLKHIFKPAYSQYEYIEKMANSENEQDKYLIKLIEDGFNEKVRKLNMTKEEFHIVLSRINVELAELWEISKSLNQAMSSYYVSVKELVDVIWDKGDSLVGTGRGSAAGFYICYLLGITTIDSIKWDLPHWRHVHRSKPDISDIDIDTEGLKRPQILRALKEHFGEDKVIQVCTYGTEGSKSSLQTACRGLGIDVDTSQFLSGMIPFERGANWSLSDCFFGNEEKERKPIKEFIREVEKFPKLKETALKLENLVNKRSIHAGGVLLLNEPYYESNAMMKAPNGTPISQYNLKYSEKLGNVKYDLLTIEGLDKIRSTIDLLITNSEIEWQGSLRDTFDHYFHPDVLEYDDESIWDMLGSGEIMDLFQFSTEIGQQSVMKVKPRNLLETAVTNSLMRLMSDGEEQPVDTYIKFKNNINLWYEEMKGYGLTEREITVLEKYLKPVHGVADTQEVVMQMVMDENISSFDVKTSNYLRKSISKKDEKLQREIKTLFFEKGKEIGTSENMLSYVWNVQIMRQIGYSFSLLHTLAYSMIALQELNLNYRFNPIYWSTACLTVNSGSGEDNSEDESKNRSTDYGKVATAIGNIMQRGIKVELPNINKANFGFTPDIENNSIVFGLKGLNGIGDDAVHTIISNRPYASFDDFLSRMFQTGLIKKGQMIQLIKAGCFDVFGDRTKIMKLFMSSISETKSKLTMSNLKMLVEFDLIPEEFNLQKRLYNFKNYISKKVYQTVDKPKDKWFLLDDHATQFFNDNFTDKSVVDFVDGNIVISEKLFKKEYDEKMVVIKEWLTTEEPLIMLNEKLIDAEWQKYCGGTLSKWEMDSLSFYYHEHELNHVNKEKYGIVNYFNLPEEPIKGRPYTWRGREMFEYETVRLVGTVLNSDKMKHTVTLLTTDGVVTAKFYSGQFSHYSRQISQKNGDKKEVLEKSWFGRGNLLMITGFRRGSNFVAKTYKNSIYQHSVAMINEIDENGNLSLTTERVRV